MSTDPALSQLRLCSLCRVEKAPEEFHLRGAGRQRWCRSCRRTWDAAYHARTKPVRLAQKREAKVARMAWLYEVKSKPCVDCGGSFHPAAMTFDHLPGTQKLRDISTLVVRGCMQMVVKEMEKCELVCANCHAVRTYLRRQAVTRSGAPSLEEELAVYSARLN
jgi:hypothetical protein